MDIQVKKRDGRKKPYNISYIKNAIQSAVNETHEDVDIDRLVGKIDTIIKTSGEMELDIEEVQNLVEEQLKEFEYYDTYNAYHNYREMRSQERERNSKKEKFYTEVLQCTNTDNDNANINQHSFSGRKYRIADNEQKNYAMRNLISEEVKKKVEDGSLKIHDLNSYAIGEHNCLNSDNLRLLSNGFSTRNGDVRPANSFSTACQQLAVIFQIQSQVQFGGVASAGIDWELEPFVHKSFVKLFKEGLFEKYDIKDFESQTNIKTIHIDNKFIKEYYPKAYDYAVRHLEKEGNQSCQGLYHNLNTLESRAGSQVPFTSINEGRNTSTYGRLITKWMLNASIDGIGKLNMTSIFPISIFQYKKGINDKEGTPNYDLKVKAIESMCKRIYPNWVNGDWKQNVEEDGNYRTFMSTMGKCKSAHVKPIEPSL